MNSSSKGAAGRILKASSSSRVHSGRDSAHHTVGVPSTLPPKKVCLQKKIAVAANLLPPKVCREKFAASPEKLAPYILPPKKSLPPFKSCFPLPELGTSGIFYKVN